MNWIFRLQLLLQRNVLGNLVGVAMASMGLGIFLFVHQVIEPRRRLVEASVLQTVHTKSLVPVDPTSSGDGLRLRQFRTVLSDPNATMDQVRAMFDSAKTSQLMITQSEYRTERDRSSEYQRLIVTLPVSGSYPQVRSFVFGVLADHPGVALDTMTFKRINPDTNLVRADLRFALYQRSSK